MYRTTVVSTEGGFEQRNQNWANSRRMWNVTLESWDEARLATLHAFFIAREGMTYGFRFKDWADYYVGMKFVPGAGLAYDVPNIMPFGTGNGSATTFQLTKSYVSGGITKVRKITRPISATVKIYKDGVLQTSGYTLNASTGVVTFSVAPANGVVLAWAGQFDVPARFDTDQMSMSIDGVVTGSWAGINIVELRE